MQNNEIQTNYSEVFIGENGKKGVKLQNGQVVVPALYDEIAYTYGGVFANTRPYVAVKDGKFGLVSPDGKGTALTPFVYDEIIAPQDILNHFLYKKDGSKQLGLLKCDGREVTPCIIDSYSCNGQTVYFRSGEHQGLWQWAIDVLLEPIYDETEVLDINEPTLFTLDGKKGYVKVGDHSFIPQSMKNTMDADAWHDLLLECICDEYEE